MKCLRCGSENVNVQAVAIVKNKKHGCLYWLIIGWWLELFMWIFLTLPWIIIKIFKPKKIDKEILEKPDWETVVEMMYDKQLDCFDDEVIRVIYSKDKSKRYLILKKENGILTYLLEYVYQFDDEEWNYISNQENALPAMWEPYYTNWGVSHFEKEEELMKELIHEPEYKQFFS